MKILNPQNQLKALSKLWPYMKPWQRKLLLACAEVVNAFIVCLDWINQRDIYIFPMAAGIADYYWMKSFIPNHPIDGIVLFSSAFLATTLTLFIIYPLKRQKAHWVKANSNK